MTANSDRNDPSREPLESDDPQSLEDLVAGAFGDRKPPPEEASEDPAEDAVFTPPAGASPEPEPVRQAPAGDEPPSDETPRKRSIWKRLQVSPAVIVASLLAGFTGAAADYWFEELATFFGELRAADTVVAEAPVIDIPPAGVARSDFSAEETPPVGTEPLPAPSPSSDAAPPEPAASEPPPGDRASREAPEEAAAPAAPEAAPADRVRLITWDEEPSGTVVTFWGNGPFLRDRVIRHRVAGGAPRELVKLRGIDLPFRQTVIEVGTPELVRVRTGFHPQNRVNELHVVLDLAGPGVELTRAEAAESYLRLHLEAAE